MGLAVLASCPMSISTTGLPLNATASCFRFTAPASPPLAGRTTAAMSRRQTGSEARSTPSYTTGLWFLIEEHRRL